MPASSHNRIPSYRLHKASNQGYVVLNGRAVYLGVDGKPETRQRYHQVIAEWLAAGPQSPVAPEAITVQELIARFWKHATQYHVTPDAG